MAKPLITPPGIASYAFVWKPQPSMNPGQEPKYSITLLVDKKADLKELKRACLQVARDKFGEQTDAMIKKGKINMPFRDGDEERADDDLYAGKIFFSAKSSNPPKVVDRRVVPIDDETDFYSGCICRLSVNPFTYDVNGNKGVAFGLQNVQKLKDGERIGGRSRPEEDFDDQGDDDEDDNLFGGGKGADDDDVPF